MPQFQLVKVLTVKSLIRSPQRGVFEAAYRHSLNRQYTRIPFFFRLLCVYFFDFFLINSAILGFQIRAVRRWRRRLVMTLNGAVPTEASKYPDAKHRKHSKSNDYSAAELFPLRRSNLRHIRFLSIGNLLRVLLFRYCLSAARRTQFLKLLIRDFPLFSRKVVSSQRRHKSRHEFRSSRLRRGIYQVILFLADISALENAAYQFFIPCQFVQKSFTKIILTVGTAGMQQSLCFPWRLQSAPCRAQQCSPHSDAHLLILTVGSLNDLRCTHS